MQELANQLAQNENPSSQTYVPKIIKPPEGAHTRIHVPVFPTLSQAKIQDVIDEGISKQTITRYNKKIICLKKLLLTMFVSSCAALVQVYQCFKE